MNELLVTLVHGGNWTERERMVGRWIKRLLVVLLSIVAVAWNFHWQKLGSQNQVWRSWVNEQCRTGVRDQCMSYVDFALPSGMPAAKFWTAHPQLAATASCVERAGWITFSIGRQDYSSLQAMCEDPQGGLQESRTPISGGSVPSI